MSIILFQDYTETKVVYHVVTLSDLKKTLQDGIKFNGKQTYLDKYSEFHHFIDTGRSSNIPDWVIRARAIFCSMNFKEEHIWHSHSAILKVKIKEDLCWICNENIANFIYEPLMLSKVKGFEEANEFLKRMGSSMVQDYWNCSLSFQENLKVRNDKKAGYDAEVLVLHDIPPEDIELLYIVSDHKWMEIEQWKAFFCKDELNYAKC